MSAVSGLLVSGVVSAGAIPDIVSSGWNVDNEAVDMPSLLGLEASELRVKFVFSSGLVFLERGSWVAFVTRLEFWVAVEITVRLRACNEVGHCLGKESRM